MIAEDRGLDAGSDDLPDRDPAPTARRLVSLLVRAGRSLAVAESLTGGQVCAAVVGVPGASAALRGGVVAYTHEAKVRLLDVPLDLLDRHGAVHPEVALVMARGVRARLDADYGLATTGVAGPTPADGHPPGTYHVAVVGPWGEEVRSVHPRATSRAGAVGGSGGPAGMPTREEVRAAATAAVLGLALRRAGDDLAPRPVRSPRP